MELRQIEEDVQSLSTASGRQVGTPGHKAARSYIVRRLTELRTQGYAKDSFELPYQYAGQNFVNIVGQLKGAKPDLAPVLLGAHYDTCGQVSGADDTMRQRQL